jgi:DMSO/TMAO reductase YedYZ molybdopterin-dependent catalytic subunit
MRNELSLSYADIRAMPSRTCVAALECAGNSRVFMAPPVPGAQWQLGAVGNAEWTGVPLAALLERAGLADDVCELGARRRRSGRAEGGAKTPEPDLLCPQYLAGAGDGVRRADRLPDERRGSDARSRLRCAIVPGHYAMASVKWLTDIVAATQPFQGYWQTSDYGYWDDSEGIPVRRPLGEMKLKSQIARPRVYERLEPGRCYTIFGAAWAADTDVTEIWISLDGGGSWVKGDFVDPISRHAWRRWKYDWRTPTQPGRYKLLARAKGADQRAQPDCQNPNYGSYVIDHPLPIEVFVAAL